MNYLPAGHSPHSRPNFSIKAVDVLNRQSLDDRFQTPIFFRPLQSSVNDSLDHRDHHSQSAIDNLNHQSIISLFSSLPTEFFDQNG